MPSRVRARAFQESRGPFALAAAALLSSACAPAPREAPPPAAARAPEVAPGASERVEELVRSGELRRAFRLARDEAEENPGDRSLSCYSLALAARLGDYRAAQEQAALLRGAGTVRECDVPALVAELERLRAPASATGAARARELRAAARSELEAGRLEAAQANLLAAWELAHPNGLLLVEAGALAAARRKPSEARALYDRGLTELEQQTGATVAAEPPRAFEGVRALESAPGGGGLAIADARGLSVLDGAFEEIRRFPTLCSSLAWAAPEALLCAAEDGRVLRFDPETASETELARLPGRWPAVAGRGLSWVAVGGGKVLASDGVAPPAELPFATARSCALSPNGELIALGLDDGAIALVWSRTRKLARRVKRPPQEPEGGVRSLQFSDDGSLLAGTFEYGQARVVRVSDGRLLARLPFTGSFRFDSGATRLVTSAESYVIGAAYPPGAIPHRDPLALSSSGSESLGVSFAGALVAQPLGGETARELRPAPEALGRAFDMTLGTLAAAAHDDGRHPWPVERDAGTSPERCADDPGAASADGHFAVCAGAHLRLLDARAGRPRWTVPLPLAPAEPLEVSAELGLVLIGGANGRAALLDLESGRTLALVTLSRVELRNGEATARGYVTDPGGNLAFLGPEAPEPRPAATCRVGPFVLPLDVCRHERVDARLLARVFRRQK